ncbi:anthranilate synthase component I family protein [Nonlabens sp.]|uniref:anthranilate synthase component I family protein n=1 Tax=Nonlabens sp. TaxID=1888209 RepID=UPI001BCE5BCD|nr:anthranilate synthase component I family protein [Nonlabens sp.]
MKQRQLHQFPLLDAASFKKNLLSFYAAEKYLVYLESNQGSLKFDSYASLIGVGAIDHITCKSGTAFEQLNTFRAAHQDWMFGFLSYDLKNELEDLESTHQDLLEVPEGCFFVPELVFEISEKQVRLHSFIALQKEAQELIQKIQEHSFSKPTSTSQKAVLKAKDSKEAYLQKAYQVLDHIHRGDIYEANFCTQFYAEDVVVDAQKAFYDLNSISEPPFAVYARYQSFYAICASPERYLKKTGNQLISQPIKGTAKRSADSVEDESLKAALFNDPKERSENVMIVDLVRNDLSKTAVKGSVAVEELFGIYSFKQVHQMISTVTAELDSKYTAIDALKTTFPMGSMTGAPKISAMEIIDKNESFKRGWYSGAIGYFTPHDDFDFNVVIRTILYNEDRKALSFSVGSALTAAAIPEKEYEECLLKAKALFEVLALQGIDFD